jgi:hypothetical protein
VCDRSGQSVGELWRWSDERFIDWAGDGSVVAKKSIDNTGTVSELVPASAKESVYDWALVGQMLYWSNDWKARAFVFNENS